MEQYLPEAAELPVHKLAGIFGNMSESYKIFWFQAIVNQVAAGKEKLSYKELIFNMVADAWYMVSEYKLNLGPSDTLEKLIHYIFKIGNLKPGEEREKILTYLDELNDTTFMRKIKTLTEHVPYHLLAPFLPELKGKRWDRKLEVMEYVNNIYKKKRLLYYFENNSGYNKEIIINEQWAGYIRKNEGILKGWIQYNLISYLQKRNPSVPGIPNKIYPPSKRKLERVRKLWSRILEIEPIEDIYTGKPLIPRYWSEYGRLSIDHFIPWSYVAHDELWNLTPTFQRVNSSKGNALPDRKRYLDRLCRQQYRAYRISSENSGLRELFQRCGREYLNSPEATKKLYLPGIGEKEFEQNLKDMLSPVYLNAQNMGFEVWKGPEK